MKDSFLFIVSTHVSLDKTGDVAGPAHSVIKYLEIKKKNFLFIKHPIFSGFYTEFNNRRYLEFWEKTPLRFLTEGILTLIITWQNRKAKIIFIGVDPLNALWGIIARKLGWISKTIFYSPDYSRQRYGNNLVNTIYHIIDRFCAKNADFLWAVSSRIVDLRQKEFPEKRTFWVPNSIFFNHLPQIKKGVDADIVLVANISKATDINSILSALKILKKRYRLKLIGVGEIEKIKKEISRLGLEKNVVLKGRMTHEQVYEELKKSKVGLALYTSKADWTYFCDPMKVRDYLACGLPVIMTDIPAIAEDIKKYHLGKVLTKVEPPTLARNMEEILENKKEYKLLKKRALDYSKKNDLVKILDEVFRNINQALFLIHGS